MRCKLSADSANYHENDKKKYVISEETLDKIELMFIVGINVCFPNVSWPVKQASSHEFVSELKKKGPA